MKKNGKPSPVEKPMEKVDKLSPRDSAAADFPANRSGRGRASRSTAKVAGKRIATDTAAPLAGGDTLGRLPDPAVSIDTIERLLAADAHETAPAKASEALTTPRCTALDIDSLLHRCLNDATFCAMLLQKFVHRAGDQLSALDRAFQAGNLVELARQAHTLKGLAVNLSAGPMTACANDLEHFTRSGELARLGSVVQQMHVEVNRCLAEIPTVIARLSGR